MNAILEAPSVAAPPGRAVASAAWEIAGAHTPAGGESRREDLELLEAPRRRDEAAFATLVRRHSSTLRLALLYVPSRAVAEEVVQETWLGVIQGLDRFEGRSSLRTWIIRILLNRAKTRGARESRTIPLSSLGDPEGDEPAVEPERFLPAGDPYAGRWALPPAPWDGVPELELVSRETRERLREAIDALPLPQRQVLVLRDVEGWSSKEVCALLGLSEGNQRVVLHRARSKVRRALESYLAQA